MEMDHQQSSGSQAPDAHASRAGSNHPSSQKTFSVRIRGRPFILSESQIRFDAPNYFTSAFDGDFIEASSREIGIMDRSPALFEKYIFEYLAGYELDLAATSILEVKNLLVDAQFYCLDALVAMLKDHLAEPEVPEEPKRLLAWPPTGQHQIVVEYFDITPNTAWSHLHTFRIKNVEMAIQSPHPEDLVPEYDPRAAVTLGLHDAGRVAATIREILQLPPNTRCILDYDYDSKGSAGEPHYEGPWSQYVVPGITRAGVHLQQHDRTFSGSLLDLWQGLYYLTIGILPNNQAKPGLQRFLSFCGMNVKTDTHLSAPWEFFPQTWWCTEMVFQMERDGEGDGALISIRNICALRAEEYSSFQVRMAREATAQKQVQVTDTHE